MSLSKRIAQNTIIQYIGKIIGTILGLVTVGIMTRYLGTEGFGYYTTVMGFLQFFGIMVDFGLSLTTAQMLGHSKWNQELLFANILSLRAISALIFLGIAPLVVVFFPYPGFVKAGIAVTTLSFFFMSLTQIFLGYYQKHLSLQYVSYAEVGNRLFLLIAIILAVHFDWGLISILIAIILSNAIQLVMLMIPAKKFGRIYLNINREIWVDIWQKTWPIAVSIALNLLYLKTDIIILSVTRSPAEVGLYGAAYKVIEVLVTFPLLFAGILLPLLSHHWQTGDKQRFRLLVQEGFDAMSLLAWPIMVGTFFVGADVMALVAGESFRASGFLLQLLVISSGVVFFNSVFAHAIVALNKQRQTIWAYGITAVIGLVGYSILIPKYGPIGAAIMTIVTESLVAILVFSFYLKYSKLRPNLKRWRSALFACIIMGLALHFAGGIHYGLQILLGALVYAIVLLLTGAVSKSFLLDLLSFRKQRI